MVNRRALGLRLSAVVLVSVAALGAGYTYLFTMALAPSMRLEFYPSLDPLGWVSGGLFSICAAASAIALWRRASWAPLSHALFAVTLTFALLIRVPWGDLPAEDVITWCVVLIVLLLVLGASLRWIRHAVRNTKHAL